jgi:hypothetical protein
MEIMRFGVLLAAALVSATVAAEQAPSDVDTLDAEKARIAALTGHPFERAWADSYDAVGSAWFQDNAWMDNHQPGFVYKACGLRTPELVSASIAPDKQAFKIVLTAEYSGTLDRCLQPRKVQCTVTHHRQPPDEAAIAPVSDWGHRKMDCRFP